MSAFSLRRNGKRLNKRQRARVRIAKAAQAFRLSGIVEKDTNDKRVIVCEGKYKPQWLVTMGKPRGKPSSGQRMKLTACKDVYADTSPTLMGTAKRGYFLAEKVH